jgi:hypothetical protein
MIFMRNLAVAAVALAPLLIAIAVAAQRDLDEPTSVVNFVVLKQDNGKPVRSAAVIMHPVNPRGKQGRGGMELKTDTEGKSSFDGIPYGKLRVQVLARGFQTYGEDFDVNQPKVEITIKLKRPQGQYSIYEDHAAEPNPKQSAPPPDNKDKKPN